MLSRRLIRKLEGLSGSALQHLEAQADVLLRMRALRGRGSLLRVVHRRPEGAAAAPALPDPPRRPLKVFVDEATGQPVRFLTLHFDESMDGLAR